MRETATSPHGQLIRMLAKAQARIEAEINKIVQTENKHFLIQHWQVLSELSTKEGRSMGEVQRMTAVNDSTLTKTVDRLVTEGLVFRRSDETDRRKVLIFLSQKGATLQRAFGSQISEIQDELLPKLSENQLKNVQQVLHALSN